jgi:hypothetical protein
MSDAAFKTAAYPAYSTAELRDRIVMLDRRYENRAPAAHDDYARDMATIDRMRAEIERREKAAAGDRSVMTDGERLRHSRQERVA